MANMITKKLMLKALETQPLGAEGVFFEDWGGLSDCKVCALGAVFREALGGDCNPSSTAGATCAVREPRNPCFFGDDYRDRDDKPSLKKKEYLHALSYYYEGLMARALPLEKVRKQCISWVKRNVPDTYRVKVVQG